MNSSQILTGTCLCFLATGAFSEENQASLTAMLSVDGKCQMLIVSDEEHPCKDVIINTEYDSGRLGFYFFDESEGGGIISFTGMGKEQRSPAENLRMQPLDALIIDGGGFPAVGFCTFGNPFVGPARIECAAVLENGEIYSGFFLSDGSAPQMMGDGYMRDQDL